MSDYLYSMSNPSIPGVIRIDQSNIDPREKLAMMGSEGRSQRIDWVVRVADGPASLAAVNRTLAIHADDSWPGHFRCDPMSARASAIQFTTVRELDAPAIVVPAALPSLVLGLGLSVHFLGQTQGHTGPSAALIAAALFWVVYTLPIGSGGRASAAQ